MYELIFYFSIILAIIFLITTIFMFFSNNIVSVCKYLFKMKSRNLKYTKPKKEKKMRSNLNKKREYVTTDILGDDRTEVLDDFNNYSTVVLNYEETELLPNLSKK